MSESNEDNLKDLKRYIPLITYLNEISQDWMRPVNQLQIRLTKLEKVVETLSDISAAINRTIEALHFIDQNQRPYTCPVCDGRGHGIYLFDDKPNVNLKCSACEGKGVLWV